LSSLTPEHELERTAQDSYRITFNNGENQRKHINVVEQDFHAMGKKHLGDIVASAG
jgi:hypothetical protein